MPSAKIVPASKSDRGYFVTTTKNTNISQRSTLEEIKLNLCDALGIKTVCRCVSSRGAYFYEVQGSGFDSYQSASNTILALSRRIAEKRSGAPS